MIREIEEKLFSLHDEEYRLFQAKLMPGVPLDRIIGVRTPILRRLGKEYARTEGIDEFLGDLPHRYYDENNLHGFIISECRDYDRTVAYVDALLPYVDNWATCDLLSPKTFARNRDRLASDILRWMASDKPFTVRFGIEMAQSHFLDDDFEPAWLERVAAVKSGEYYVNMMRAWFFATALTKRPDAALPYLTAGGLDEWTHNKTIQKAIESYRIPDETKQLLRTLRK